jgi:preprotein translocase SecF subunit
MEYKLIADLRMRSMFNRANFNFVGIRRPVYIVSFLVVAAMMVLFIWRGERNLGQDFTGGVLANIAPASPLTMAEARELAAKGLPDFPDARDTLQSYGAPDADDRYSEFVVRTKLVELDADAMEEARREGVTKFTADDFRAALRKAFDLVPDGFTVIGVNELVDASPDKAFDVRLSLQSPETPAGLFDLLASRQGVRPLFVGPVGSAAEIIDGKIAQSLADSTEEAVEFGLILAVPVVDASGAARDETAMSGVIREALQEMRRARLVGFTDPFPRFTSVGRTVARTMESGAALAVLFSAVGIFAYVWLRFQFRVGFGVGTIIALIHDTLFTMGALAVADQLGILNGQIDLTVMAAILTVMGYSLNDSIVVLDRIREHIGDSPHPSDETINAAINETLSRTIITSLTTLFVSVSRLIVGGDVMRGFSFALLVGVIAGTFSSVFIASPILVEFALYSRKREQAKQEKRNAASFRKTGIAAK